jgi:hypothetical protein
MNVCVYVCIAVPTYVCMDECMDVCVCMHGCMCVYLCMYYVRMYVHMCVFHVCVCVPRVSRYEHPLLRNTLTSCSLSCKHIVLSAD